MKEKRKEDDKTHGYLPKLLLPTSISIPELREDPILQSSLFIPTLPTSRHARISRFPLLRVQIGE